MYKEYIDALVKDVVSGKINQKYVFNELKFIAEVFLRNNHSAIYLNYIPKEEALFQVTLKYAETYTNTVLDSSVNSVNYDKLNKEMPEFAVFKKKRNNKTKKLGRNKNNNPHTIYNNDLVYFQIACILNLKDKAEEYIKSGLDPSRIPIRMTIFGENDGLSPLDFAIVKNYYDLFTVLIKNGGNLDTKNAKGLTPLHGIYYSNISNNRKSWIDYVFKCGNDTKYVNSQDNYGVTHFMLCCMLDEPDFVKRFIHDKVDVNHSISLECPLNPGFTALHFAVKNGCINVIKLLLENGADPNKFDKKGRTSLYLAFKNPPKLRGEIINILLAYNASPVAAGEKGTALHKSFYYVNGQEKQIFDKLLSKTQLDSDNYTDAHGLTFFHIACSIGNVNQVQKFLNSGVNIDSCVSSGMYSGFTGLHFAVMYNQEDVVKILLERNANVNARTDQSDITPLHLACEFNYMKFDRLEDGRCLEAYEYYPLNLASMRSNMQQMNIIKLLLSHGADVNAKDSSNITPLLHACMIDKNYCKMNWTLSIRDENDKMSNEISNRLPEIIEILIAHRADVQAQTSDKSTILHILSKYGYLKIYQRLIRSIVNSGANINAVNNNGLTPLHIATEYGNKRVLVHLLSQNANPNIISKNVGIPLHIIVKRILDHYVSLQGMKNEKHIFSTLLESGSDTNIRYPDGTLMLSHSLRENNDLVLRHLLYYGADVNMEESGKSSIACLVRESRETIHLYGRVRKMIYMHVLKLKALGLPVSEGVRNCCKNLRPKHNTKYNILENCYKELHRMKAVKIDSDTSLYDILLKHRDELIRDVRNGNLVEIINNRDMEKIYPMYGYLLKLQYKKGLKRRNALESADTALRNILKIHLPDLCCRQIFKHLENEDIYNLKLADSEKSKSKRR